MYWTTQAWLCRWLQWINLWTSSITTTSHWMRRTRWRGMLVSSRSVTFGIRNIYWRETDDPEIYDGAPASIQVMGRKITEEHLLAVAQIVDDALKSAAKVRDTSSWEECLLAKLLLRRGFGNTLWWTWQVLEWVWMEGFNLKTSAYLKLLIWMLDIHQLQAFPFRL